MIWHTQGSGKSLTMVFLARKMRSLAELRAFKVVIVTDRVRLERQPRETAALPGENVRPSPKEQQQNLSGIEIVQRILREDGPALVFRMMQKNQDTDLETETLTAEVKAYVRDETATDEAGLGRKREVTRTLSLTLSRSSQPIEALNTGERILLLIDECHRAQAGNLHAYMTAALPNAAKIGFTGTPIFNTVDKNTLGIFGRFLGRYGMTDSWRDGATVEVLYEGRAADGIVEHGTRPDWAFDNRFKHHTEAERAAIRQRCGNEPDILFAEELVNSWASGRTRAAAMAHAPRQHLKQPWHAGWNSLRRDHPRRMCPARGSSISADRTGLRC